MKNYVAKLDKHTLLTQNIQRRSHAHTPRLPQGRCHASRQDCVYKMARPTDLGIPLFLRIRMPGRKPGPTCTVQSWHMPATCSHASPCHWSVAQPCRAGTCQPYAHMPPLAAGLGHNLGKVLGKRQQPLAARAIPRQTRQTRQPRGSDGIVQQP